MDVLNITLDNLPELITTEDFATLTRLDIHAAQNQIRKHKEILRPFKLGRETRIEKESFEVYYALLKENKIS